MIREVFVGLHRLRARNKTTVIAVLGIAAPVTAGASTNPPLTMIALLLIVAASASFLLPRYVRSCIAAEDRINLRFGLVSPGRLLRIVLVLPPMVVAALMVSLPTYLAVLAELAAAGAQTAATRFAYRGTGDRATNSILAYAASFWLTALAGYPGARQTVAIISLSLAAIFLVDVVRGLRSDIQGVLPHKGGVGIFFGTFNPVHRTHIEIIRAALADRALEQIYLHCTTVPKLHRDALAAKEIEFDHRDGMRVYRRTERADPNKNYFPTGNMFFESDVRNALLKASIRDAGLEEVVCVLHLPELYERKGFLGVARHVRDLHPGVLCHGIHGSDPGGMWVRNIFEACGGVRPYPVLRRNDVSATAIRRGASGMTTPTVERFLAAMRAGHRFEFADGMTFDANEAVSEFARPPIDGSSGSAPGIEVTGRRGIA